MTIRLMCLIGFVLLCLAPLGPTVAAKEPTLSEAEVRGLLHAAAEVAPPYWNTVLALDPRTMETVLHAQGADIPFTLAILSLAHGGDLESTDITWLEHATPAAFVAAIFPLTAAGSPQLATASILRPGLVRQVNITRSGSTASGTVAFGADKLFKAVAHWHATYDPITGWQITEIALKQSAVSVRRVAGRWTLHVPRRRSSINPRRGTALRLPRISRVGHEPPEAWRILISVTAAGYIHVGTDEKQLSLSELSDYLRTRSAPEKFREADGSSQLAVLLDVDHETPWVVVQWLMQICAHPATRLYKIYLAARSTGAGVEGAIGAHLPKDRGGPTRADEPPPRVEVKAFRREHAPSDPRALYAALKTIPLAKRRDAMWELNTPPPHGGRVPYGYVLQVLDAMLAAGAANIMFEGAAMPIGEPLFNSADALAAEIALRKAAPGSSYLKLGRRLIAEDAPTAELPQVGRVEKLVGAPPWGEQDERRAMFWFGSGELLEEVVEREEVEDGAPAPAHAVPGIPAPFDGRAPPPTNEHTDKQELRRRGAVDAALRWLAAHQTADGSWQSGGANGGAALHDIGVSGLAVCAFLGAGYTHRGEHDYARVVSKGLRYLKNSQDPEGCFGPRKTQQYGYSHAAAALAMVEAYGMTRSPIFKGSAQRALDFIALSRNPYFAWRYGIRPGDNDTSLSAWMFTPLASAKLMNAAASKKSRPPLLSIDANAFKGLESWLSRVTDKATGRIGYVQRGKGPARVQEDQKTFPVERSEATTAAGALCRMLSGVDPRKDALLQRSLARLQALPPRWDPKTGDIDMIYWYWGALAAHQAGGTVGATWHKALDTAIVANQRTDAAQADTLGSWDPIGVWGSQGGRAYATALLCMTCQASRRYERIHK